MGTKDQANLYMQQNTVKTHGPSADEFMSLCERHADNLIGNVQLVGSSSLSNRQLAEVCLASGDMQDSLGLRSNAHQLWQQALMLAEQECQALGLKERQVQCYVGCCHVHDAHA